MAGYDTALRLGDLLLVEVSQLQPDTAIRIRQHKTGRVTHVRLRQETCRAAADTIADHPADPLVWPLWGQRDALYRCVRETVAGAGIRPGTFRWLRRSAATQVERVSPGRSTELLGHASRGTTERWYLDRSQLADPPLPPW